MCRLATLSTCAHATQEYEEPNPAAYSCFNEFFYRRIRPAARPIAAAGDPGVVVSAADCR
jgi:phosphatidylserine decarboxylase